MSTGKTSTYIRKISKKDSLIANTGYKKTRFLHQATSGQTLIQLASLTTPTGVVGYSAPNVSELLSTNLMQWSSNVTLTSSLRGVLIQNLAYVLSGASTIKLLFDAADGEVFEGIIDHNSRVGTTLVDAAPLVVSGVLTAGSTDFNVGTPFKVGSYPAAKRGVVAVEVDGQPVYRTDGNAAFGSGIAGDYYEVHAGEGLGQIIRFQPDMVNDRFIMVTSVGSLVERPDGSLMAIMETLQGQIDAMVPTLAELAEVDPSVFQAAPNDIDLKSFGDSVTTLVNTVASLSSLKRDKADGMGLKIGFTGSAGGTFSPANGDLHFIRVVAPVDAIITRMSAFHSAKAAGILSNVGIFSDVGGFPSARLGYSNEIATALNSTGSTGGGQYFYDLVSPVTITKGTVYWLAYQQNTTSGMEIVFNSSTNGLYIHKAAFGYSASMPASVSGPFTSPSGGMTCLGGW